jgi:hypothetical protein
VENWAGQDKGTSLTRYHGSFFGPLLKPENVALLKPTIIRTAIKCKRFVENYN